jgi:hypothetical protein
MLADEMIQASINAGMNDKDILELVEKRIEKKRSS